MIIYEIVLDEPQIDPAAGDNAQDFGKCSPWQLLYHTS